MEPLPEIDKGDNVIAGVLGTLLWIVVVILVIGAVMGFIARGRSSR